MFTILQDKLISCSVDQTIKIWSLDNSSSFKNADKTLYDHEEEIVVACVCPQPDRSLMASADVDGQIIVRDITEPENPICHIKPEIEYEPPEVVSILFNKESSLSQADSKTCDIFIAINNQLFQHSLTGECLKVAGFSTNILSMAQDKHVLVLGMENNTLIAYDWKEAESMDEFTEL